MFNKVLIANRGEIALRIVRALQELGIPSLAVYADDDAQAPHVAAADEALALGATGPAAYLDGARLLALARERGADALHPGYGFLSERADFARACAAAGVRFIGPTPEQLELFGDKAQARALAARCGVPLTPGSSAAVTLDEAQAFLATQGGAGVMLKAIGGGGGRGMRAVRTADELTDAYERCRREARAAFGVDGVYVERLIGGARHIEVQVLGDGRDAIALGERECTLQRRFQKLVEIAPSPSLPEALRTRLTEAALTLARAVRYEGLGTFEFLVDEAAIEPPPGRPKAASAPLGGSEPREAGSVGATIGIEPPPVRPKAASAPSGGSEPREAGSVGAIGIEPPPGRPKAASAPLGGSEPREAESVGATSLPFVFMEANARLQVEHTITEEAFGVDLVQAQIRLAGGATLRALGLDPAAPPRPRGFAIQWRINAETLDAQGNATPGSGQLARFDLPAGPGIRVDTHGLAGTTPSPHYDSLLAKLIVHAPGDFLPPGHPKAESGPLGEQRTTRSEGAWGSFLQALRRSQRALAEFRIEGVATNLPLLRALAARPEMATQQVHTRWLEAVLPELLDTAKQIAVGADPASAASQNHSKSVHDAPANAIVAPMPSRLVQLSVAVGDEVPQDAELAVLEAMKMEHVITAPHAGRVGALLAVAGGYLAQGQALLVLEPIDGEVHARAEDAAAHDPDHIRADLQRVIDRHAHTLDAARPEAMAKRHARGSRSARENIADLCDEGSFIEYGALAIAAQTRRRSVEDLIANTPADGMVTGIGGVNGAIFGAEAARTVVMAYDATVLAGTQGMRNHAKTDRMLGLALDQQLPTVLFAEGGGGRPGDTDTAVTAGLHITTFAAYAALSGRVPVVGVVHGYCFAGNAALVGCSDVIIATRASNLGMGGPAMIEGGGLGVFKPEDIGPSGVQHANGVIDLLVDDEAAAVAAARQYLGYFQGRTRDWITPDQRLLRAEVPENRLRVYDTRKAMQGLVDEGSLLMLRSGFGAGIHTALARIEGRPVGLIANNPLHLGGAIDAPAADKAARFMQLCNAHGLPIVSLIDTPGFMVGPEVEKTAQVRHVSRLFVTAASLRVPFFSVVLRKGYGLGAMGMAAGGFHAPVFTVSWPTGEFGGMGLEGAVRLGFRKELEAAAEGPERDALFARLVAQQYHRGEAINMATTLEIDAVIDPAETRAWLARGLAGSRVGPAASRFIDTW